ncbi:MAG: DUF6674 family protein [Lachnospiraceae bacterium]
MAQFKHDAVASIDLTKEKFIRRKTFVTVDKSEEEMRKDEEKLWQNALKEYFNEEIQYISIKTLIYDIFTTNLDMNSKAEFLASVYGEERADIVMTDKVDGPYGESFITRDTINKLDAFGSGMREAGQKIANIFRTFADKETVDYSEKEKKFSKTELVKKPFEAKKKLYQRMEKHLDEALDKVNSLAKEPERMKDVEMAETSMLGAVAEPEFQYGADAFEAYQQSGKAETAVVSEVKVQEVKSKSR